MSKPELRAGDLVRWRQNGRGYYGKVLSRNAESKTVEVEGGFLLDFNWEFLANDAARCIAPQRILMMTAVIPEARPDLFKVMP